MQNIHQQSMQCLLEVSYGTSETTKSLCTSKSYLQKKLTVNSL